MAATILTIAAKAFDAGLTDMTAMTGGNSEVIGEIGSDWGYFAHNTAWNNYVSDPTHAAGQSRKRSGGEQLQPVLYSAGADPLPVAVGDSYRAITHEALDALDSDSSSSHTGGVYFIVASSRLGSGLKWTLPVTMEERKFWWLGRQMNGGCTASISISDGSIATQTYALPTGSAFAWVNAWFEATYRGTGLQVENGVTVEIKVERTSVFGGQPTVQIGNNVVAILPPTAPPRQRAFLGRL